jgi:hypothetical protein
MHFQKRDKVIFSKERKVLSFEWNKFIYPPKFTSEPRYTISVLLEQNFSKSEIAIVIKRQVRFHESYNVIVIYAVVNMI